MSFEEFKNELLLKIRQEITRRHSDKIWGLVMEEEGDQYSIFLAMNPRPSAHPLSLNQLYAHYLEHPVSMESLASDAVDFLSNETKKEEKSEFEKMKDKIYFQLINAEKNQEHLKEIPHRKFLDLEIIYRAIISRNEETITASLIDNEMMERFGITEEDLYKAAVKNMPKLFPSKFSITRIPAGANKFSTTRMPAGAVDKRCPFAAIIRSEYGVEGSTMLLYPNELSRIADTLQSDLYLIPLSRDEMFAVCSEKDFDFQLAKDMIQGYLASEKSKRFLSDTIYYYSRGTERVYIAE